MGSVTDLLNMANFRIQQEQMKQQNSPMRKAEELMALVSEQVKKKNVERKSRENQNRLSDMLRKDVGNLDPEYTVGEAGTISVKYKPRKTTKNFAGAVKEAGERIKAGEDYSKEALDLETRFPTKFTSQIEKHLKKSLGVKEGEDPSKLLKEEKATEELTKRAGARQPLDTQIPQPKEGGWFGIGAKDVNEATTNFAQTVKTRQDLINMVKNADALEEQGVDISELEDLYEDELLKLAKEGYLTEK